MADRRRDENLTSRKAQQDMARAAQGQQKAAERLGRATRLQAAGRDDRVNPDVTRKDKIESRIIDQGGRN